MRHVLPLATAAMVVLVSGNGCANSNSSASYSTDEAASRSTSGDTIGEIVQYADIVAIRKAPPARSEPARRRRAEAIASAVRARYAGMHRLSFHAVGFEPPSKSFYVECRMTRDSLHVEAYLGDHAFGEPVFVVSLLDGIITEKSRFGGTWRTISYPAMFPSGTGNYRLLEPGMPGSNYWCSLGGYSCTWLGPGVRDSSITVFDSITHTRLLNGEYLGETWIGDAGCSVVVWESDPAGERTVEVFYVAGDGLLAGMDQFVSDGDEAPMLQRRRRFTHIEAE